MSLRVVHIFFIVSAAALASGFAAWALLGPGREHAALGKVSAALVPVLVAYLFWFVRKRPSGGAS